MKKLIFLLLLGAASTTQAQHPIFWRQDKVSQLIFPSDIVKNRAGYSSEDALTQCDGRVLYLQPLGVLNETNLNVVTADGSYYAFDVIYCDTVKTVNYIITPEMAFYREAEADSSQEIKTGEESVPESISTKEKGSEQATAAPQESMDSRLLRVRKLPDYILSNNVASLQKLMFVLKGVYVDSNNIYFRFNIINNSNVPFDVDYIAFSVAAQKSKKAATQERIQILPIKVDEEVHRIDAKSTAVVVYAFEKFTIGKDKVLLAEVLEQGGDRNISLPLKESFIIEARKL